MPPMPANARVCAGTLQFANNNLVATSRGPMMVGPSRGVAAETQQQQKKSELSVGAYVSDNSGDNSSLFISR